MRIQKGKKNKITGVEKKNRENNRGTFCSKIRKEKKIKSEEWRATKRKKWGGRGECHIAKF